MVTAIMIMTNIGRIFLGGDTTLMLKVNVLHVYSTWQARRWETRTGQAGIPWEAPLGPLISVLKNEILTPRIYDSSSCCVTKNPANTLSNG